MKCGVHAGLAILLACALAVLAAACASTRIDAQWKDPAYGGAPLGGPVLVVGMTRDETLRRLYEDALAAEIAARGARALKSYGELPEALSGASSQDLLDAARRAGAAAVLSTTVIGREQYVVVDPLPAYPMWYSYPGWYGYHWPFAYPRFDAYAESAVRTFERYIASTSLTDVASGRIVWTARSSTDMPGKIEREVKALAREVVAALGEAGLIRAPAASSGGDTPQ